MKKWTPAPPTHSTMGDHDVPSLGPHLAGKRIALLVCGGIAAMKAPSIARALRRYGATVIAYTSAEASRYVGLDALHWASNNPVVTQLSATSEHLSKQNPFDAYLVAPATYNTINKLRFGIADTPITTTLAAALGLLEKGRARILLMPTMHGDLYNSVVHESLIELSRKGVCLIPPRNDYGKHNIADPDVIAAMVCAEISESSLKNKNILLTAGCTPCPIDNVRRISNRFRGRLGIEIAKELTLRGANVRFILGGDSVEPPTWVETISVPDYDSYKKVVLEQVDRFSPTIGIFSAAVADYRPKHRFEGKIPSGGQLKSIELTSTEKIIDLVKEQAPRLHLVSFKYQENMQLETLLEIARSRIAQGHHAVVANRGEEKGPNGEQIAYLVSKSSEPQQLISKAGIARGLCDWLEADSTLLQSRPLRQGEMNSLSALI